MKAPLEETWYARNGVHCCEELRVRGTGETITIGDKACGDEGWELDEARFRLAAQAPEMARLLVEVYNRVNDPLADRVLEVLEKAGVLRVERARVRL